MSVRILAVLALLAVSVGAKLHCQKPRAPLYGYINGGQKHSYIVGNIIIIKCNRGYQLVGNSALKCLSRGSRAYWNYRVPICRKPITRGKLKDRINIIMYICDVDHSNYGTLFPVCGRLNDPRYGDVSLTGIKVGAKARYTCNRGFTLKGNSVRTCQFNGRWSGSQPFCKRIRE